MGSSSYISAANTLGVNKLYRKNKPLNKIKASIVD